MKRIMFFKFTLLCFPIIFLQQSAQNCKLSLPESAIARLCPGGNASYSPDGRTLATSISRNWSQEIQLWNVAARKLTSRSSVVVHQLDGRTLSSVPALYGIQRLENTS